MADPLHDGDPTRIGPYELHARLGAGGMGQVYLGRSPGRRLVAVKVVRPELTGDAEFRRRFADEVRAARKVGGAYTAPVLDAGTDADPPWLATAYVPGLTLHQAVARCGPLSLESVAALGAGLAEGLAAVHGSGIVHRDLKPGNVLLAEDGPRVIDFGIARAMDATSFTQTSTVLGTAAFMSPEQARAQQAGPASDVFSLGCVLAFAATGRSPFGEGPVHAVLFRVVHEEPDLADLPAPLAGLVSALLAKSPDARPDLDGSRDYLATLAPRTQAGTGGRWLDDDLTEVIAEHTTRVYTLIDTDRARATGGGRNESAEPGREDDSDGAREDRFNLEIGNLGAVPVEVVVDGTAVGTVPPDGRGRYFAEPGLRTVQVDSGGRLSAPRRTFVRDYGPARRIAFDTGPGPHARPAPVERPVFTGTRTSAALTGAVVGAMLMAVLCGLTVAAVVGSGSSAVPLDELLPVLAAITVGGGAILGLIGAAFTPDRLVLDMGRLELGAKGGTRAVRWNGLAQVCLVGRGPGARIVVWPRRGVHQVQPLWGTIHRGGRVLCTAGQVGATGRDFERLRAALRWFADGAWSERPTAP